MIIYIGSGRHGQNVMEFEKQFRCMIDLRTAEESSDGMVPVDITAKESRVAYKAKDEILKFLDRFFPSREWADTVELGNSQAASSRTGAFRTIRTVFA